MLILEDDVLLSDNFTYKLSECIKDLPDDWSALMLGGTDHPNLKSKHYSTYLNKCFHTTGAFAILFNRSVIPVLIKKLDQEEKLVDIYYAESMKELQWFRSKEKLVIHPQGFSEIKGKFVDYKHLR